MSLTLTGVAVPIELCHSDYSIVTLFIQAELRKEYNPVYPEYAEEVKALNDSPNNNKLARAISLQKTFETQDYPSRSQVT